MTSGIQSKGADLDSIFALYQSGTHPTATGIEVNGTDIATRYQPLPGTAAAATGILTNGADLNTLFSTTSGPQTLPLDGQTYSSTIVTGSTGETPVSVTMTMTSSTVYAITNYGGSTLGSWTIPSGVTQFTSTATFSSGSNQATTVVDHTSETAFTAGLNMAEIGLGSYSGTPLTRTSNYSILFNFYNSAGALLYTGTCTFYLSSQLT